MKYDNSADATAVLSIFALVLHPYQGHVITRMRDDQCAGIQKFNLDFASRWQNFTTIMKFLEAIVYRARGGGKLWTLGEITVSAVQA